MPFCASWLKEQADINISYQHGSRNDVSIAFLIFCIFSSEDLLCCEVYHPYFAGELSSCCLSVLENVALPMLRGRDTR